MPHHLPDGHLVSVAPDFIIRKATDQDAPFIFSSVAKSWRSSPYAIDLDDDTYKVVINQIVTTWFTSPKWTITVAHPEGFPDEIAGYITHAQTQKGKPVLGFLYVKTAYRRMGIGRQLLEHVLQGKTEFVAVLAHPRVLGMCRDRGLRPQLSPYFL